MSNIYPEKLHPAGFIRLHRKIFGNPRSNNPRWMAVWVYLLTHATHQPYPSLFGGKRISLAPGQLVTGRKAIAADSGVSESTVTRLLAQMKADGQIEQETSNQNTLITIRNWSAYQSDQQADSEQTTDEQPENNERTATEQQANTYKHINHIKHSTNNVGAKESPPASKTELNDEQWLSELQSNPTYAGLDVRREHGKMSSWCLVNGKQPSRRRFVNWLNRCERPMRVTPVKTVPATQTRQVKTIDPSS